MKRFEISPDLWDAVRDGPALLIDGLEALELLLSRLKDGLCDIVPDLLHGVGLVAVRFLGELGPHLAQVHRLVCHCYCSGVCCY